MFELDSTQENSSIRDRIILEKFDYLEQLEEFIAKGIED